MRNINEDRDNGMSLNLMKTREADTNEEISGCDIVRQHTVQR